MFNLSHVVRRTSMECYNWIKYLIDASNEFLKRFLTYAGHNRMNEMKILGTISEASQLCRFQLAAIQNDLISVREGGKGMTIASQKHLKVNPSHCMRCSIRLWSSYSKWRSHSWKTGVARLCLVASGEKVYDIHAANTQLYFCHPFYSPVVCAQLCVMYKIYISDVECVARMVCVMFRRVRTPLPDSCMKKEWQKKKKRATHRKQPHCALGIDGGFHFGCLRILIKEGERTMVGTNKMNKFAFWIRFISLFKQNFLIIFAARNLPSVVLGCVLKIGTSTRKRQCKLTVHSFR